MNAATPLLEVEDYSSTFRSLLWLSKAKPMAEKSVNLALVDWPALIRLAAEQSMLSLVGRDILVRLPSGPDHSQARAFLRDFLLQNTQRNLTLAAETLRLLAVLDEVGIEAFPFKGCVLASVAFGNLASRRSGDIDLLVRRKDVEAAYQALEKAGYVACTLRTPAQQIGHLAFDCEWELINHQRRMVVDLHWGLSGRNSGIPLSLEYLWKRQQEIILCGRKIRAFSPADTISVLCVHAAKHQWQRLEWIYTLASTLRRFPELNWLAILEENTRGAQRILTLGLLLADDLYETDLPEEVRSKIRSDEAITLLGRRALDWLFAARLELLSDHDLRKFNAAMRPGLRGKAYYWFCAAMTPTAKDYVVEFPAFLHWIYYIIRAARLLFRSFSGLSGLSSLNQDRHSSAE